MIQKENLVKKSRSERAWSSRIFLFLRRLTFSNDLKEKRTCFSISMNPEGQLKFSGKVLLRESKKWAR